MRFSYFQFVTSRATRGHAKRCFADSTGMKVPGHVRSLSTVVALAIQITSRLSKNALSCARHLKVTDGVINPYLLRCMAIIKKTGFLSLYKNTKNI